MANVRIELTGTATVTGTALYFVTTSPLANGQGGVPYTNSIVGAGGVGPYAFTVQVPGSFPPGLTLDPSGFIYGTPTAKQNASYTFFIDLTDGAGTVVSKQFTILIVSGVAIFSDNFTRANTAAGIGDNYILQSETQVGNETQSPDPFPSIDGNALLWSNAGSPFAQYPGVRLIPRAILPIYGLAQYAQIVWTSTNNVGKDDFLWVMVHGSVKGRDFQGYFFGGSSAGLTTLQLTYVDAAGALQGVSLGTCAFVPGDTCRIEVIPGVASNRVAAIINGVKLIDVVDADANRPQNVGTPALAGYNMLIGIILKLDSFECGYGTVYIS